MAGIAFAQATKYGGAGRCQVVTRPSNRRPVAVQSPSNGRPIGAIAGVRATRGDRFHAAAPSRPATFYCLEARRSKILTP